MYLKTYKYYSENQSVGILGYITSETTSIKNRQIYNFK